MAVHAQISAFTVPYLEYVGCSAEVGTFGSCGSQGSVHFGSKPGGAPEKILSKSRGSIATTETQTQGLAPNYRRAPNLLTALIDAYTHVHARTHTRY